MGYLIKETTRQEREQIVQEALDGGIGCDDGAGISLYEMYQPYIDGEMELSEVTRRFTARYVHGNYGPEETDGCPYQK